jgi:zona occludens toxin (predicted ATPase)
MEKKELHIQFGGMVEKNYFRDNVIGFFLLLLPSFCRYAHYVVYKQPASTSRATIEAK